MQSSTPSTVSVLAVVSLATILLAGCSPAPTAGPSEPNAEPHSGGTAASEANEPAAGADGEALLSYGETTFSARLAFCSLDGNEDALFHGPAFDASGGEVGYLSGDFTGLTSIPAGEARIDLGATDQFQSMDEFIAIGSVAGDIVITDFSETDLIVIGAAWQADGTKLPTATLKVTC